MISSDTEQKLFLLLIGLSNGEQNISKFKSSLLEKYSIDPYQFFMQIDNSNKGYITKNDIVNYLTKFKVDFTGTDIDIIFLFYDKDNDDVLNFLEFLDFLISDLNILYKKIYTKKYKKNQLNDYKDKLSQEEQDLILQIFFKEIDLARYIFELVENVKNSENYDIQEIFYSIKSYNYITPESIKAFFDRNNITYEEKDIKSIFKRFSNKDKSDKISFNKLKSFFELHFRNKIQNLNTSKDYDYIVNQEDNISNNNYNNFNNNINYNNNNNNFSNNCNNFDNAANMNSYNNQMNQQFVNSGMSDYNSNMDSNMNSNMNKNMNNNNMISNMTSNMNSNMNSNSKSNMNNNMDNYNDMISNNNDNNDNNFMNSNNYENKMNNNFMNSNMTNNNNYSINNENNNNFGLSNNNASINEEDVQFKCSHNSNTGSPSSLKAENNKNYQKRSNQIADKNLYSQFLKENRMKSLEKSLSKSPSRTEGVNPKRNIKDRIKEANNIKTFQLNELNVSGSSNNNSDDIYYDSPQRITKNLVLRKSPKRKTKNPRKNNCNNYSDSSNPCSYRCDYSKNINSM